MSKSICVQHSDEKFQPTAEIVLLPVSENKRSPYWNFTSGFHIDLFIVISMSMLHKHTEVHPNRDSPDGVWRHVYFSRWRPDAMLDLICVIVDHPLCDVVGSGLQPTYLLGAWPNSLLIWPNYLCIVYAAHAHAYRFAIARILTAVDYTSLSSGHSFTQLLSRVRDVWPFVQLFVDNVSSTELTLNEFGNCTL